jgi:hypothetical protein
MANGKAARLQPRRHQGESTAGRLRGPNTGAWEKVYSGWRNYYIKFSPAWNSKYDGSGKGTW